MIFKRQLYLIRWFLIGRYHCGARDKKIGGIISRKLIWKILNRLVWGIITFAIICCIVALLTHFSF